MLKAGKTGELRKDLSNQTGVDEEEILELVQLSDITRLGYVKAKLARLYHNAGIKSPQDLAVWDPEKLQKHFQKYVEDSGWQGQIPYLKDLTYNINNAKKLEPIVE